MSNCMFVDSYDDRAYVASQQVSKRKATKGSQGLTTVNGQIHCELIHNMHDITSKALVEPIATSRRRSADIAFLTTCQQEGTLWSIWLFAFQAVVVMVVVVVAVVEATTRLHIHPYNTNMTCNTHTKKAA